jgi:hypothetical protein
MTTDQEFSPETLKAMDKIQKLLNLAAKAGTPEEAAAAMGKAQELLALHNLSEATVTKAKPEDGKREQAQVAGGFYAHQRDLWRAVAELNFCLYWTQTYREEGWKQRHKDPSDRYSPTERFWGLVQRKRHALIGRVVNVRLTITMAQYLEQAVERIAVARFDRGKLHHFSNWAQSFRKGATVTLIDKLEEKRQMMLNAEEKRRMDAAAAGHSTATALTLATYAQSEDDANEDFRMGEVGYSARRRQELHEWRQQRAAERAAEEEAYTRWAAEHPEEAAAQAAAERREDEKREKRQAYNASRRTGRAWRGGADRDNTDWGAYRAGREAAEEIGIDPQMDTGKRAAIGRK